MMPHKYPYRRVEFLDGVYEISCVTDDWDKDDSDFNETLYFHLVNLGWETATIGDEARNE